MLWASNLNPEDHWYICEDCQVDEFGEWTNENWWYCPVATKCAATGTVPATDVKSLQTIICCLQKQLQEKNKQLQEQKHQIQNQAKCNSYD